MKKFLSMVLALVMAMSLVTISAGAADFTDASSIDYAEAVEVMTAVGVVDGYADGSFGPDGYLTRGAAAKIICNLILGPTTAEALVADAAPYSDVPTSNVFAGYIAYCQKEGIISGYADGTFRPGNSLTGYAFMKMLLGALGYNAEQEGYTGNNWSINVAKQAINLGLEDGLEGDFVGVNTVTRQEALLYAFNTMKATMVEYPNNSTIVVGDITVSTNSTASAVKNDSETTATNYINTSKGLKTTQFCEKYFGKLKATPFYDEYGRPATTWKYKNSTIGTYAEKADLVYTTDAKIYTLRQDLGLTNADNAYFTIELNTDYSIPGGANAAYWSLVDDAYLLPTATSTASYKCLSNWITATGNVEYYDSLPETADAAEYAFDNAYFTYYYGSRDSYYPTYGGVTTEVYYDAETQTGTIVVIEELFAKVNGVKTDDDGRYVTVAAGGSTTGTQSDWKFYTEDFNKNDLVIITVGKYASDGAGDIVSMVPAEKISGTMSYINGSTYVVIDGTGYYMLSNNWIGGYSVAAGDEVNAYLTPAGRIAHIVVTEANSDAGSMVLLTQTGSADLLGDKKAIAIYGDGTQEVVTMYEDYTSRTYTINGYAMTNGKMKLTNGLSGYQASVDSGAAANFNYTKGTPVMNGVTVDANTNFVYIDDVNDTIKTYAGYKNAPSIINNGGERMVSVTKNNTAAAALVYVWVNNSNLTSTSSDYMMVIADTYYKWSTTDEDGAPKAYYALRTLDNAYLYVDAISNVNIYTTDIATTAAPVVVFDTITYDTVTGYAMTAVNVDVDTAISNTTAGDYAVLYKNGVLYLEGTAYALADEVAVYVVANNRDSFAEADVTDLDGNYMTYVTVRNDDGEIETVVLREKLN